jgi:hypothetical protein
MMMSAGAGAARATGSSTTDRKICSTDTAFTLFAAVTRARGDPHRPRLCRAERPARAGWAALRLLADVAIFILAELLFRRFWLGAMMEAGRDR